MQMSIVPEKHEKLARELIQRVGGVAAAVQFDELSMAGYNGILAGKVRFCAAKSSAGARVGEKGRLHPSRRAKGVGRDIWAAPTLLWQQLQFV
jgi:hypothetical protein